MESKEANSLASKVKTGLLKKTASKISLGEIFNDRIFPAVIEEKLYIAYFNEAPDSICISDIKAAYKQY